MDNGIKHTILVALSNHRGDDLERARMAFQRFTQKEMDLPYGQSDATPREILAAYEQHRTRVDLAIQTVEAL